MAKNRRNKYEEIKVLPPTAMSVSNYAKQVADCNVSYLYKLIRLGKNKFRIVEFQGTNYILP